MGTPATTTTAEAYLKEVYSNERIADETAQQCKTLARLREKKDLIGKYYVIPVTYGGNEDAAPSSQMASVSPGHQLTADFQLPRLSVVKKVGLSYELFETAKKDRGAFVDGLEHELGGTRKRFAALMGTQLFRSGSGSIGQIASGQGTKTVTLTDVGDAVHFRPGMTIRASTADGTGALKARGIVVSSVDYMLGTVSCEEATWDEALVGIDGPAANDFLFQCPSKTTTGFHAAAFMGFGAWCPATAPAANDSFCAVNRSVAPNELAGLRGTASGGSIEGAIIDNCVQAAALGRTFKHIILNPYLMGILIKELGSKVVYTNPGKGEMAIGASTILLRVPVMDGVVEVISDNYCQRNTAWFVDLDDWFKGSTPSGFMFLQTSPKDGSMIQWSDDDGFQLRLAVYGNYGTSNPGNIMRVTFTL